MALLVTITNAPVGEDPDLGPIDPNGTYTCNYYGQVGNYHLWTYEIMTQYAGDPPHRVGYFVAIQIRYVPGDTNCTVWLSDFFDGNYWPGFHLLATVPLFPTVDPVAPGEPVPTPEPPPKATNPIPANGITGVLYGTNQLVWSVPI